MEDIYEFSSLNSFHIIYNNQYGTFIQFVRGESR